MEIGRLPVRDARHDDALDVLHDGLPRFGLLGHHGGQQMVQITGLDGGQNGPGSDRWVVSIYAATYGIVVVELPVPNVLQIVGHKIDGRPSEFAKLVNIHSSRT